MVKLWKNVEILTPASADDRRLDQTRRGWVALAGRANGRAWATESRFGCANDCAGRLFSFRAGIARLRDGAGEFAIWTAQEIGNSLAALSHGG
jgi:hypothetical protein